MQQFRWLEAMKVDRRGGGVSVWVCVCVCLCVDRGKIRGSIRNSTEEPQVDERKLASAVSSHGPDKGKEQTKDPFVVYHR